MNPNKEYHDLNPNHSRAAWNSILECMLSDCNWVKQAQLKQPCSVASQKLMQLSNNKLIVLSNIGVACGHATSNTRIYGKIFHLSRLIRYNTLSIYRMTNVPYYK